MVGRNYDTGIARDRWSLLLQVFLFFICMAIAGVASAAKRNNGGGTTLVTEEYSGRAYAVHVGGSLFQSQDGDFLNLSDTGEWVSPNPDQSVNIAETGQHNLADSGSLSVAVMQSSVGGSDLRTHAQSLAVGLDMVVAGVPITASVLQAESHAVCSGSKLITRGSSYITNLVVADQPIEADGTVDQVINMSLSSADLLGLGGILRITLNEQVSDGSGHWQVTALKVEVLNADGSNLLEVFVARSVAGVAGCGSSTQCDNPMDFVTGGGRNVDIDNSDMLTSSKVSFGFNGGKRKDGELRGHLNFIDHDSGFHFKGTIDSGNDAYTEMDALTRRIKYNGTVADQTASCALTVSDQGEAGINDTYSLVCDSGYRAASDISGHKGNIQLHKPACGETKTRGGRGK